MIDKLINTIKDRQYVVSGILLKNYKQLNITSDELLLLIYLTNTENLGLFNPVEIAGALNIDKKEVMLLISQLVSKKILSLQVIKNDQGKMEEHISLNDLFNKLTNMLMDDNDSKEDSSLFGTFEKEFGRTISPMEYEIINSWMANDLKEELILEALKEAIYNGVTNLRYIDKILFEWKKKGFKTVDEVRKNNQEFKNKNNSKTKDIFEYNWLDEEE